jgi:hypothetical protein
MYKPTLFALIVGITAASSVSAQQTICQEGGQDRSIRTVLAFQPETSTTIMAGQDRHVGRKLAVEQGPQSYTQGGQDRAIRTVRQHPVKLNKSQSESLALAAKMNLARCP